MKWMITARWDAVTGTTFGKFEEFVGDPEGYCVDFQWRVGFDVIHLAEKFGAFRIYEVRRTVEDGAPPQRKCVAVFKDHRAAIAFKLEFCR
jgi:fibrillarin-like rRNA methylase